MPTGRQRIKLLSAKERARDSYTVAHECKEDVRKELPFGNTPPSLWYHWFKAQVSYGIILWESKNSFCFVYRCPPVLGPV